MVESSPDANRLSGPGRHSARKHRIDAGIPVARVPLRSDGVERRAYVRFQVERYRLGAEALHEALDRGPKLREYHPATLLSSRYVMVLSSWISAGFNKVVVACMMSIRL